ncbi:MAG TPA: efflux RND transporter periplasmic adaptor subunit [Desulfatiglandales bacterium]|nr:efflux RND transporter periplasmic adaptor subunit [Desulfatiglandales bacterium]
MNKTERKTSLLRFIWGIIPWMIVVLIVIFIVILGSRIMHEKARLEEAKKAALKQNIEPVSVITLTLKPRRLEDKINLPAVVEPYEDVWVKAEVSGQVVEVLVQEGEAVKEGQVLMQLDDRDYKARLSRIEANYQLAKLDYERTSALVRKKVMSPAELDTISAQLKDLEAQVREVQLALSRTQIVSPLCCLLNETKANRGDFVGVGDPVARILQLDPVKVTVGVPESDVAAVFDLTEAEVIIEALNKRRVKGTKVFLSRMPRTLARLYDLELRVPNPDGKILPGMFVRVDLVKTVFRRALPVPLYAVITQADRSFVYVEENGRAKRRDVELGILVGWEVQVASGLKPGERVIVVGHRFLDDDQPVKVIKNVSDAREILKS